MLRFGKIWPGPCFVNLERAARHTGELYGVVFMRATLKNSFHLVLVASMAAQFIPTAVYGDAVENPAPVERSAAAPAKDSSPYRYDDLQPSELKSVFPSFSAQLQNGEVVVRGLVVTACMSHFNFLTTNDADVFTKNAISYGEAIDPPANKAYGLRISDVSGKGRKCVADFLKTARCTEATCTPLRKIVDPIDLKGVVGAADVKVITLAKGDNTDGGQWVLADFDKKITFKSADLIAEEDAAAEEKARKRQIDSDLEVLTTCLDKGETGIAADILRDLASAGVFEENVKGKKGATVYAEFAKKLKAKEYDARLKALKKELEKSDFDSNEKVETFLEMADSLAADYPEKADTIVGELHHPLYNKIVEGSDDAEGKVNATARLKLAEKVLRDVKDLDGVSSTTVKKVNTILTLDIPVVKDRLAADTAQEAMMAYETCQRRQMLMPAMSFVANSCQGQAMAAERAQANYQLSHSKLVERLNAQTYKKCSTTTGAAGDSCEQITKALSQAMANPSEAQMITDRRRQEQQRLEMNMLQQQRMATMRQMQQNVGVPYRVPSSNGIYQYQSLPNATILGATPSIAAGTNFSIGGYGAANARW